MRLFLLLNIVVLLLCSCNGGGAITSNGAEVDSIYYAKYLSISHFDGYSEVTIANPWNSTKTLNRYALVPRDSQLTSRDVNGATVVKVPIERIIVYNSVHTSIVEMLGACENIVGACEMRYIDSELIKSRFNDGLVADIGEATAPNIEKIIDVHAEALMTSPFEDAGYGAVEKLHLPIIEGADYMEQHPLGRVEWLKFYGMLFGVRATADSIFNATAKEYLDLKELAGSVTSRPKVMAERRYRGQWFVPGGSSYNAAVFADAGGDYLFSNLESSGSVPLSFEKVLDQCIDADVWILKYYNENRNMSYDEFRSDYEPYENFAPFKNRKIYGCNTALTDYYEQIPMHPQYLLKEYIHILNPELLPGFEPYYFFPLVEK